MLELWKLNLNKEKQTKIFKDRRTIDNNSLPLSQTWSYKWNVFYLPAITAQNTTAITTQNKTALINLFLRTQVHLSIVLCWAIFLQMKSNTSLNQAFSPTNSLKTKMALLSFLINQQIYTFISIKMIRFAWVHCKHC